MENEKSNGDVLNRRLKNRERQRRYRARKRLEADSAKAVSTIQQPQTFIVMQGTEGAELLKQPTRVPVNNMSHIYCKRDWKKDARLAHLSKRTTSIFTDSSNPPAGSSHENEAPHLLLHLRGEATLGSEFYVEDPSKDKMETTTSAPIRRYWKAAARNKCK